MPLSNQKHGLLHTARSDLRITDIYDLKHQLWEFDRAAQVNEGSS